MLYQLSYPGLVESFYTKYGKSQGMNAALNTRFAAGRHGDLETRGQGDKGKKEVLKLRSCEDEKRGENFK
ncbi:MAG: hypothetical protein E3J47_01195 [Candidatus Stahlbacteria bacterium]|nr:MAG: hypothetical protein E3J47_01195 [Candidatus Stahlbacteria bacterium]